MAGAKGVEQHKANNPKHTLNSNTSCFPKCTQILSPGGWRTIGDLIAGDHVISIGRDRESHVREVLRLKRHRPASLVKIFTGDYSFKATLAHSVMTSKGWKTVRRLRIGDELGQLNEQGDFIFEQVSSIDHHAGIEPVFNIIVEKDYTFVVRGCIAHSFTGLRNLQMALSESRCLAGRILGEVGKPHRDAMASL